MSLRLAFVPMTPLLVSAVAAAEDEAIDAVRAAARRVVNDAVEGSARIVVVAPAERSRQVSGPLTASFRGFGAPVDVSIGGPGGEPVSWQAGIALDLLGVRQVPIVVREVDEAEAEDASALLELDDGDAVIVVGDGSAGLGQTSPGYIIDGSTEFDDRVAEALSSGDSAALASLDPQEARRVMCAGWVSWSITGRTIVARAPRATSAELVLRSDALGVGYFAAAWTVS